MHMAEKRGSAGASKRGFAAMDKEKQRKIASMGGRASHRARSENSRARVSGMEEMGE